MIMGGWRLHQDALLSYFVMNAASLQEIEDRLRTR